jgi:hypothetical protein
VYSDQDRTEVPRHRRCLPGVTFRAGFNQLPTLEHLFIDAEMAVWSIRTEYNHKTDYYGLEPNFPSDCTIGAFERGYVKKKYGALFAAGYKDHIVDRCMYESSAYQISQASRLEKEVWSIRRKQQRKRRKTSVRS